MASILYHRDAIHFTMKKIILLAACGLLYTGAAHAQKFSFGLTLGAAIPTGSFAASPVLDETDPPSGPPVLRNMVGTAAGGFSFGLHGRYHINEHMAAGINTGYTLMIAQDFPNSSIDVGAMAIFPLMGAFDYYFMTEKFRPFVGVEAGLLSTSVLYSSSNYSGTISASSTGFGVAPVIGARIELGRHFGLLANIKYMQGFNKHDFGGPYTASPSSGEYGDIDVGLPATSYLAINVGVNFSFGQR